jgi:predicted transcriptional regulator
MPKKTSPARISITIPADLLKVADRLARQLDRSRSWVLGEAVRRMAQGSPPAGVREPLVNPYAEQAEELEAVRLRRLKADLAATPAERLRDAEEILQMARRVRPARKRAQVIAFDSYEDYYRWKTIHRAGA